MCGSLVSLDCETRIFGAYYVYLPVFKYGNLGEESDTGIYKVWDVFI